MDNEVVPKGPRDTPTWIETWMGVARLIAQRSKDRSKQVGCVIVTEDLEQEISKGWNGFIRGADDEDVYLHERPQKYRWSEHAERNAIYNAARLGRSTLNSVAFMNWFPCIDCARALHQAGVKKIYWSDDYDMNDARWYHSFQTSKRILTECGVELKYVDK